MLLKKILPLTPTVFALSPCLLFVSLSLSAKTRLAGLESLRQAFSSKVLYDFLTERRLTISDCLERSLKKGTTKQIYVV